MSRIGNQPVPMHKDVSLEVKGRALAFKGPKGEFNYSIPEGIEVKVEDALVSVSRAADTKRLRAMHGTTRALIANMIEGCVTGYEKNLELHGVGFRAQLKGKEIVLALGYSHPIHYIPPEGVTLILDGETNIKITGPDKQKVGQAAAQIRSFYPAEPYKGKGVRYKGEQIRRKTGKAIS